MYFPFAKARDISRESREISRNVNSEENGCLSIAQLIPAANIRHQGDIPGEPGGFGCILCCRRLVPKKDIYGFCSVILGLTTRATLDS